MYPYLYPVYPMILFRTLPIPENCDADAVVVIAFVCEHFKLT